MSEKSVQETFRDIVGLTADAVLPSVNALLTVSEGEDLGLTEINYIYGHGEEVAQIMADMANDTTQRLRQFPLIWLEEDIEIVHVDGFDVARIKRLAIVWASEKPFESQERENHSFVPVLRPIWNEFIRQIGKHPRFWIYDDRELRKGKECKLWGTDDNAKAVFSDYVDAIEMRNIELKLTPNNCS